MTGTAANMLAASRLSIGISGRPNVITRDYASRHGSEFLKAPWCDMTVTRAARQSGNAASVLPSGDRAYTVWHAEDFMKVGRWFAGTVANVDRAKPGDIVFFDWGESNSIDAIDHVGVVETVLGGGRVQTIEGNTGDACRRRVRAASVIAGYGRPAYASPAPAYTRLLQLKDPLMRGDDVTWVQRRLNAFREQDIEVDGVFGPKTHTAVRTFQTSQKLEADGLVGPLTWEALAAPVV